jgi:hypothetical protein
LKEKVQGGRRGRRRQQILYELKEEKVVYNIKTIKDTGS